MTRKSRLLAVGMLLGAGLLIALVLQGKSPADIPAGTGYAALDLCTRTMQSHEPATQVRTLYIEPKVAPLPLFWRVALEPKQRVTVSTWLPFFAHPRPAIYREGLGCTIVPPGSTEAAVRAQPFVAAPQLPPDARPWPLGEGPPESDRLDAPTRAVIERHATRLFAENSSELKHHRNTTALLVARDGHLLYERYAQGHGRQQPQLGWSMTKTLTAIIAGTLARDGKLALDQKVGLSRWKGTPKEAITWRALLNMAPGLQWFEGYGGASDATQMLFSQADEGAWAADRPLVVKPGTVFNYSTGFTNIAILRMRELLGGTPQAIYDHYQSRVFAPLGIRGAVIEPDASGTPVGGARGLLRPVDWLRLGQLVEYGGSWNGVEILPADWVQFMLSASPASPTYAGSLWLDSDRGVAPAIRARLPKDVAYFAGFMGQLVVVVPSRKLVLLRMGAQHGDVSAFDDLVDEVLDLVADLSRS